MGANLPKDTNLPLFVYGALKPGEISWPVLERFVDLSKSKEDSLEDFHLVVSDGTPYAQRKSAHHIRGFAVRFKPGEALEAYSKVAEFEGVSLNHYAWGVGTRFQERFNLLIWPGESSLSDRDDHDSDWTTLKDPFLGFAIPRSSKILKEVGASILRSNAAEIATNTEKYRRYCYDYLELQANFITLWTLVERFSMFRLGIPSTTLNKSQWWEILQADEVWERAVKASKVDAQLQISSVRAGVPSKKTGLDAWWQMRNNVVHQGKGEQKEVKSLLDASVDLHNTLARALQDSSERLRADWLRLEGKISNEHDYYSYIVKKGD